jgi:predicted flap endonuclease-1-like 5' DNA nuclease
MGEVKSMLASSSLMIGLLLGVNAMARPEKDANLLMWAIFFLIAAIGFWFWVSREQRTAEEAAEDAIDAAEGIKKKVEIKSADDKPAPAPTPSPAPEPRAAAPTPPPAPTPRPEPDAPVPQTAKASSAEADDLTRIEGIGPKIASILLAAGIDSFAKLAAMSEDAVLATVKAGGLRITPNVNTWAEQAKLAANGDWDGLARLQQGLRGGKRY